MKSEQVKELFRIQAAQKMGREQFDCARSEESSFMRSDFIRLVREHLLRRLGGEFLKKLWCCIGSITR